MLYRLHSAVALLAVIVVTGKSLATKTELFVQPLEGSPSAFPLTEPRVGATYSLGFETHSLASSHDKLPSNYHHLLSQSLAIDDRRGEVERQTSKCIYASSDNTNTPATPGGRTCIFVCLFAAVSGQIVPRLTCRRSQRIRLRDTPTSLRAELGGSGLLVSRDWGGNAVHCRKEWLTRSLLIAQALEPAQLGKTSG